MHCGYSLSFSLVYIKSQEHWIQENQSFAKPTEHPIENDCVTSLINEDFDPYDSDGEMFDCGVGFSESLGDFQQKEHEPRTGGMKNEVTEREEQKQWGKFFSSIKLILSIFF